MSECSFCGFVGTERQVLEHSGGWGCAEQLRHVREILQRQLADSEQQVAECRDVLDQRTQDLDLAQRRLGLLIEMGDSRLAADLDRQQYVNRITDLEDQLQGMRATMQQWRTLAGQMTEERDRVTLLWENAVVYSVSLQNQREALKGAVRKIEEEHQSGCRVAADMLRQCVLERDELTRQRDEYLARVEAWEEGHRLRALDRAKEVARMHSVSRERDALRQQLADLRQQLAKAKAVLSTSQSVMRLIDAEKADVMILSDTLEMDKAWKDWQEAVARWTRVEDEHQRVRAEGN